MELLGLVFVGSATDRRAAMTRFVATTLGLPRVSAEGFGADVYELPDGSRFAVDDEREPGRGTSRTVGFLVGDLDAAVAELRAAGVPVDDALQLGSERYAHFHAPDGELYELVQRLG